MDGRAGTPGWRLVAIAGAIGGLALNAGPIKDPDVYWHSLAGQYTLDGARFPFPDPWSFSLPGTHWHTSSFGSEAALAVAYNAGGYAAWVVLRAALGLILLAALWRLVLRGRTGWGAPVVYATVALPLSTVIQERPQTVSLIFCCWLAKVLHRQVVDDVLPRRLVFIVVTYAWAWLHGLFVLAPGLVLLLALAELACGRYKVARSLALSSGAALAACAVTPMGPRLLLAPLAIGSAARDHISEWAPTQLTIFPAWGLGVVLIAFLIGAARSSRATPPTQLLLVLALAALGLSAFRNANPAAILLAPFAVTSLESAWAAAGVSTIRVSRAFLPALGIAGALAALGSFLGHPALPDEQPQRIAAYLADRPGSVRVLNDYNVSGYLLREASPHVLLAVDGRAERYGATFLDRYQDMMTGGPDWEVRVKEVRPDVAVLDVKAALTQLLVSAGWTEVLREEKYVLLTPPGTVR